MIEQDIVDFHICLSEIENFLPFGESSQVEKVESGDISIEFHSCEGDIIIDNVLLRGKKKIKYISVIQDYFNEK